MSQQAVKHLKVFLSILFRFSFLNDSEKLCFVIMLPGTTLGKTAAVRIIHGHF